MMAFTTFIMTVLLVTIADANFPDWAQNNFEQFDPLNGFEMPTIPPFEFPEIPAIPPIKMPIFNMPSVPTPEQIAKMMPPPNGVVNAAVASSQSKLVRGPDGKLQRVGGSSILINDNGKVTMQDFGKAPPNLFQQKTFDSFKSPFQNTIKPLKLKPFSPFKFKPFEPITFKPFSFKPIEAIDPDMIRNYVPGEGENYKAQSISTSSFSKNINGVKSEGARGSSIINDNGNVNADDVGYYKADPNPETEDN